MKRKGFLAALLGLAAAPVLAKVKVKPEFPWYFCCLDGDGEPYGIYRAEASGLVFTVLPPPHGESVLRVTDKCRRYPNERNATIHDAEGWVRRGYWKEITAAEAEALLKPKRPLGKRYTVYDELDMMPGTVADSRRIAALAASRCNEPMTTE